MKFPLISIYILYSLSSCANIKSIKLAKSDSDDSFLFFTKKHAPEVLLASENEVWLPESIYKNDELPENQFEKDVTSFVLNYFQEINEFIYAPDYKKSPSFPVKIVAATLYDIPEATMSEKKRYFKIREQLYGDCSGYPNSGIKIDFKAKDKNKNFYGGYLFPRNSIILDLSQMPKVYSKFINFHLKYLQREFLYLELDEDYIRKHSYGIKTPSGNLYLIAPKPKTDFFDASVLYKLSNRNQFIPQLFGFTASCST
jgi:hypothetical protein